jgi:hypothetical protein
MAAGGVRISYLPAHASGTCFDRARFGVARERRLVALRDCGGVVVGCRGSLPRLPWGSVPLNSKGQWWLRYRASARSLSRSRHASRRSRSSPDGSTICDELERPARRARSVSSVALAARAGQASRGRRCGARDDGGRDADRDRAGTAAKSTRRRAAAPRGQTRASVLEALKDGPNRRGDRRGDRNPAGDREHDLEQARQVRRGRQGRTRLRAARTAKRHTKVRFGRTVSLLTRWKLPTTRDASSAAHSSRL